jgi:hypothetical protein
MNQSHGQEVGDGKRRKMGFAGDVSIVAGSTPIPGFKKEIDTEQVYEKKRG